MFTRIPLNLVNILVPFQVGLSIKPLIAVFDTTRERMLVSLFMHFPICFEIVAPAEEYVTAFDMTIKICVLFCSEFSGVLMRGISFDKPLTLLISSLKFSSSLCS